ncbi:MAG: sterol desaturase family protein [Microscillaceae bacterium]
MMSAAFLSFLQPFVIGGVFVLLYLAEHGFPQRPEKSKYRHDVFNLSIGLLNSALVFVEGYTLQKVLEYTAHFQFGLFHLGLGNGLIRGLAEFLVLDLCMYGWHRLNHTWPLLWRFHRFHHQDVQMNSTSAFRFHFLELSASWMMLMLVFGLLGISWVGLLVYKLVFFPVVLLHHSNIRVSPWVDRLIRKGFISPGLHRIHHSQWQPETDSNFGSVLPWWDLLFGTYRRQARGEIIFGVQQTPPNPPL